MTVAALASQFKEHLDGCKRAEEARAKAFNELRCAVLGDPVTGEGGLKQAIDGYQAFIRGAYKLLVGVGTSVVAGLILLGAESFFLHKQAAATATTAASTAVHVARYTAADAAADRAAQATRDQAIMDRLDHLKPGTK